MTQQARYVPAAGRDFLTPFYDGFVRLTMREQTFRAQVVDQVTAGLGPGGGLHIADWGPPAGVVPRLGFAALRALDGRENTAAHAEGRLPGMIEAAGFTAVERRGRLATVLGTVEMIAAERTDTGVGIA